MDKAKPFTTAEHREPYDPRGSRTVLGARGGEIPPRNRQVVITIAGKKHWLWRAVDQEGFVLDVLVQSRRDKKAAKRLLRKLLKKHLRAPRVLITDKLRSYGAAKREIIPGVEHRQHKRP